MMPVDPVRWPVAALPAVGFLRRQTAWQETLIRKCRLPECGQQFVQLSGGIRRLVASGGALCIFIDEAKMASPES